MRFKIGDKVTWKPEDMKSNSHGGSVSDIAKINKVLVGVVRFLDERNDACVDIDIRISSGETFYWSVESWILVLYKPKDKHICGLVCKECNPREMITF